MKHFTMEDCTHSNTAIAKGIDNTPGTEHKAHIIESIETLIDSLHDAWEQHCNENGLGTPGIRISSGYRGPALNKAVGGSTTSAHCHGYAFDLVPVYGKSDTPAMKTNKMVEFKHFCRRFLSAGHPFDQLISEGENKQGVPTWMHVGYKHPDGHAQRCQFLSMIDGMYCQMTK
ncbi:D-Ala-D-Ala carboxypeptidase family metallohydrolase [Bacteroides helcogenes]|uniref:Peptidase M15A n=1 Tax=Bacteroides helcogenes (strain ATCC 35417 / DSM 20613 / JCM 6297 / CCUG 15421 / P 36-108) TaxID=693979 RepID=E6SVF6_BACT6|nr:D-Ala-D-Ala carboxypeptidase family metallohydrolase [Bacteroides helcogenes]ADV42466.1 Peptidase M15A [Bacteroides helcogenes P 36-108]MDY5237776.1 D-Ala-D-Ala carboxypeptidase family metallohydrolase [Bacteroides helcogenes]